MVILIGFIVLIGVWFLFVGLPVLGLYYMVKGEQEQKLEDQRFLFERMLHELKSRGNEPQRSDPDLPGTDSKLGPLNTACPCESVSASEFHLQPPAVPATVIPGSLQESSASRCPICPETVQTSSQTDQETIFSSGLLNVNDSLPPIVEPGMATFAESKPFGREVYDIIEEKSSDPAVSKAENLSGVQDRQSATEGLSLSRSTRVDALQTKRQSDTEEHLPDELTSLELQIGRKILGWIAVGLFVLAGAFFVQLAISRGWLNPLNRFAGMILTGSGLLYYGRHLFRIGWRRYSEMINSAGIVTLFSGAYYAKFVGLFSPAISGGLLVAIILGGFLLSGAYRSMIIGYVATLGGLAIPLLIKLGPDSLGLVFYLSILNMAVVMLVNLLGRSHLAFVSWAGTPVVMLYFWEYNGHSIDYAKSGLLFYTIFLTIYLADMFLAVCRSSRRMGKNDVIRALFTPVIFFGGCRTVLLKTENLVLFNLQGKQFFDSFGSWVALGLAAIALVAAFVASRRSLRSDMVPDRNAVVTGVQLVAVFLFLGIFISLALKSSAVAIGWLAIAVGLLCMSTKRYNLFFFASVPNEPEKLAQRGNVPSVETQNFETAYFQFWSFIFFVVGISRLVLSDFLPHWVPVQVFRDGAWGFVHPLAAPITCGCILLFAGMVFVLRRAKVSRQSGLSSDLYKSCSMFAVAYGVVGVIVFILLICSESYSWMLTSAERWNWSVPEIFGWGFVLYVLVAISLIAFLWGYVRDRAVIRAFALGLLTIVALKATLADLVFHPLIAGSFPVTRISDDLVSFSDHVFLIGNLLVPKYAVPLVNPYALPLVGCAVGLIGVGIVTRRRRAGVKLFRDENMVGLTLGIWGLSLLWMVASLECAAWCEYRPETYGDNSFYSAHLLIAFWTIVNCLIFTLGGWSRSFAIRTFVYSVLLIQIPFVAWAEFCGNNWRPETIVWPLINWDALPVLGYAVILMGMGVWLTRMARGIRSDERLIGAWIGSIGVACTWLLLSFETFRFFTGKEWFGSGDWTRLIALSVLWAVFVTFLAIAGVKRKSTLLRLLAMGLLFVLSGKVLFCELVNRGDDFFWPVVNSYAIATYGASLFIIFVACTLHSVVARMLQQTRDHHLGIQLELEQYGWRWLSLIGLAFGWFASSADVYQSARHLPTVSEDSRQILAQMSLSVLWSCFAGFLLFLGFRQKSSLLRWLAISMFGLTTLKVMTVDLHQVDQIWRVIAFFVLAITLAVAAGAYQRFRPGKS